MMINGCNLTWCHTLTFTGAKLSGTSKKVSNVLGLAQAALPIVPIIESTQALISRAP
jgi:hypothetical protein